MADISKIKIFGTTYSLKDADARSRLSTLETAATSAMTLKGTVAAPTGITGLTNYKQGDCYKASTAFTISGIGTVENGDMFVALNTSATYKASDWVVLQNNVDTMSGASSSAGGTRGLVPAPAQGDQDKVLSGAGTWIETPSTKQYTETLTASGWVSSSGSYVYALVLSTLTCGSDGNVSPIISYTSNQEEYNYITSAVATAGTGITFTASQQPTSDIGILIIDMK